MTDEPLELPTVLWVLEPYLSDLVLIGGWVPALYRRQGELGWKSPVSRTTELDMLVGSRLPPNGRPKVRALLLEHGLRPARKEHFPADWVSANSNVTAIEFIMSRPGPMGGDSPRQIDEQGYLGALVVDDVELLGAFTRTVELRDNGRVLGVRVPTLGAWAVSKALTYGARQTSASGTPGTDKRAKDLLYIRDLVFAGASVLAQVEDDIAAIVVDRFTWHFTLRRALHRLMLIAENGAEADVTRAALELATRGGTSIAVSVAEIRGAARELIEIIREKLPANP